MTDDIETMNEARALAETLLKGGRGALTPGERRVVERIARRVQVHDVNEDIEERGTFGERLADRVAAVGGSWRFILGFTAFLVAWMVLNTFLMRENAFDPAPYIGLNLVLSCLAALQAPVIMMSQGRQAARDRAANDADYDTNLQSATYLLTLHEKLDRLQARLDELDLPARSTGRDPAAARDYAEAA